MQILLVEDDERQAEFIQRGLEQEGACIDHAADGEQGLSMASSAPYDLFIFDLMLPRMDGLSLIHAVRAKGITTPILVLSARNSVDDRVQGLRVGGDDYLVKPFAFSELIARIDALHRRAIGLAKPSRLGVADLRMDLQRHKVFRDNKAIDLQPKEYVLLEYLMRNTGRVVSNQLLASLRDDLQDTALEFSDLYRMGDIKALQAEIDRERISHDNELFYVRLINAKGKSIMQSLPAVWTLPLPEPDTSISDKQWFEAAINQQGELATLIAVPTYDHGWIQVGLSRHANETQLKHIRDNFGWALVIIILAGVMTGWWQVSRALAGVDRVRRTAIDIGEGAFEQRLVLEEHGQELVALADAFNVMLDKIQQLLGEMRDVSDNIAHDLRTPVTRIRGMAEAALMASSGDDCENQQTLAEVIDECDRLNMMINTMLEIAQSDSGALRLERKPVDMAALLHEVCDLFSPVAEDADIDLKLELNAAHLMVSGDQSRLQRLMANLVDNAIKFSPAGSRIRLTACREGETICLFVIDSGIGISEKDMAHIFDRFYRSDRSRSTPGNGLGLSYAKSIATAHGGDIQIQSQPGSSTSVRVTLPVTPNDSSPLPS